MEYVRGRTLREMLDDRRRLDPSESLAILEQLLAALAVAHRAGLVHRDVKPENILIAPPPNGSGDLVDAVVKVADFGLAHAVEIGRPHRRTAAGHGRVRGAGAGRRRPGRRPRPTSTRPASCCSRCSPAGCRSTATGRPTSPGSTSTTTCRRRRGSCPGCRRCSTTSCSGPPSAIRPAGPATPRRCSPRCSPRARTSARSPVRPGRWPTRPSSCRRSPIRRPDRPGPVAGARAARRRRGPAVGRGPAAQPAPAARSLTPAPVAADCPVGHCVARRLARLHQSRCAPPRRAPPAHRRRRRDRAAAAWPAAGGSASAATPRLRPCRSSPRTTPSRRRPGWASPSTTARASTTKTSRSTR